MELDFSLVLPYIPLLLKGTLMAIEIAAISIVIGLILGLFTALMRISNSKILSGIAWVYITFIRGTPLLVQLFIVYFALPQFGIKLDAFTSSIVALGINGGAYMAEIFRASIISIPYGQTEAARSLGMGYWLTLRKVILPQALRVSLPPLGNEANVIVKNTSLCSVITVQEIMHLTGRFASVNFAYFEFYIVASLLYLIVNYGLAQIVTWLEHRFSAGVRRSAAK